MTDSTCCCVERPWHVKNRLALLNVATFILIFFSVLLGTSYASAQTAAFVTQNTPWSSSSYANAMDAQFGAGNWTSSTFSSVDVNDLFTKEIFQYLPSSILIEFNLLNKKAPFQEKGALYLFEFYLLELNTLYNNSASSTSTIADSSGSVFTIILGKYIHQCNHNS